MNPKELIDLIEFQAGAIILWTFMAANAVLLTREELGDIMRNYPETVCHCSPQITKVMGLIVIQVCRPMEQKALAIAEYEKILISRSEANDNPTSR
jgi:hypothetical protein